MHDSDSNPCLSRKTGDNVRVNQSGKVTDNEDWEEMESNNDGQRQQSTNGQQPQQSQTGLARRAVGGLFSLGAGVVGAGFGGVRWVASTSYSVGSGVIGKVRGTGTDTSKDKKD